MNEQFREPSFASADTTLKQCPETNSLPNMGIKNQLNIVLDGNGGVKMYDYNGMEIATNN